MGTLLKDMPIHMERIEGNYSLIGKIKDEIEYVSNFGRTGSAPEDVEITNINAVAERCLDVIVYFVNQNYSFKGQLAEKANKSLSKNLDGLDDGGGAFMDNIKNRIVEDLLS